MAVKILAIIWLLFWGTSICTAQTLEPPRGLFSSQQAAAEPTHTPPTTPTDSTASNDIAIETTADTATLSSNVATPAPSLDTRLDKIERRLEHLFTKKKKTLTNTLVGAVVSAAATAHPLGALVGGLASALIGPNDEDSLLDQQLPPPDTSSDLFGELDQEQNSPWADAGSQALTETTTNRLTAGVGPALPPNMARSSASQNRSAPPPNPACDRRGHSDPASRRRAMMLCFYNMSAP